MIYATVSEGFRPGGVNRRGTFPPYKADFLKNLEFGVKTSWLGDSLRLNAAAFRGDWDDFQFSFLGENGLTNVTNAGQAVLRGIEADLQWKASDALTLYGGFAIQRAELAQDFCKSLDADGNPLRRIPCLANNPDDFAPEGTRLPTTPRFKLNLTGRYEFQMAGFDSHFQTSIVHQGVSTSALLPSEAAALGEQEEYTLVDLALGIARDKWDAELFVDNAFDQIASLYRYTECDTSICGGIVYSVTTRPRTIGLKFHQKF
jgi:outer membrane receptor protein involved in Fe transport